MRKLSRSVGRDFEIGRLYRVPLEPDPSLRSEWGTLNAPNPQQGGLLHHLFATENVIARHARYRPGTRVGLAACATTQERTAEAEECADEITESTGSRVETTKVC